MTDDMIERVARAICRARDFERHSGSERNDGDWSRYEDVNWKNHEQEARAAIAAMREPTEAMMGALYEMRKPEKEKLGIVGVYRAMIAAALGEKP